MKKFVVTIMKINDVNIENDDPRKVLTIKDNLRDARAFVRSIGSAEEIEDRSGAMRHYSFIGGNSKVKVKLIQEEFYHDVCQRNGDQENCYFESYILDVKALYNGWAPDVYDEEYVRARIIIEEVDDEVEYLNILW